MRIQKRGTIVVIESLVGLGLLAIDAWSRFSQLSTLPLWRHIQPYLPAVYGACFLTALFLMRSQYEAADYDFEIDPKTEFLHFEFNRGQGFQDRFRVSVRNYARTPITAQVLVVGIFPEPVGYSGLPGMPIPALTDPERLGPIQINPGTSSAFTLLSYQYGPYNVAAEDPDEPDPESVILWHRSQDAMFTLETGINYTFELVLTPAEGPAKTALYQMRRKDGEPGRYRLARVWPSTIWNRLRRRTMQNCNTKTS